MYLIACQLRLTNLLQQVVYAKFKATKMIIVTAHWLRNCSKVYDQQLSSLWMGSRWVYRAWMPSFHRLSILERAVDHKCSMPEKRKVWEGISSLTDGPLFFKRGRETKRFTYTLDSPPLSPYPPLYSSSPMGHPSPSPNPVATQKHWALATVPLQGCSL
jgi:hypothetical protein